MKYTQSTLDKLEDILGESEYVVRYERGTFQSGWCLLEARRVVVLNKFLKSQSVCLLLLSLSSFGLCLPITFRGLPKAEFFSTKVNRITTIEPCRNV